LANTRDGIGGGSRFGARGRMRSTTRSTVAIGAMGAISAGAGTAETTLFVICAGTVGMDRREQHCWLGAIEGASEVASSFGQQHAMRTAEPQRTNNSPCAAPITKTSGASRTAMSLVRRRDRMACVYASSVTIPQVGNGAGESSSTSRRVHHSKVRRPLAGDASAGGSATLARASPRRCPERRCCSPKARAGWSRSASRCE
jgi:hypothetical protein